MDINNKVLTELIANYASVGAEKAIATINKFRKATSAYSTTGILSSKQLASMNNLVIGTMNKQYGSLSAISTKFRTASDDVRELGLKGKKSFYDMSTFLQESSIAGAGFGKVMGMSFDTFRQVTPAMYKNFTAMGKLAYNMRRVTHGFRGFRMELLGVMFFGMGIQKFFMGLLTPALQTAGVFDLISTILTVLFLPVALKVLDWVLKFWDYLSKNEGLQKVIRWLTIFGVILGSVLFFLGMFGLGIGSVLMAISSVIMPIIAVIGVVFGFIASIFGAIMASSKWLGILALVAGLFGIIIPGVSAASDAIKGQGGIWETVKNIIGSAVEGIKGFLDGLWEKFLGIKLIKQLLIDTFGEDFYNKLKDPIELIKEKLTELWGYIGTEVFGIKSENMLAHPFEVMGKFLETWFKQQKKAFLDWLSELIPDDVENQFSALIEALKAIQGFIEEISPSVDTVTKIIEKLTEMINSARAYVQSIGKSDTATFTDVIIAKKERKRTEELEGKQFGGFISKTGPYMLHAGETVVPSTVGAMSFSPTINIYASTKEAILYELNTMVREQLDRIMR